MAVTPAEDKPKPSSPSEDFSGLPAPPTSDADDHEPGAGDVDLGASAPVTLEGPTVGDTDGDAAHADSLADLDREAMAELGIDVSAATVVSNMQELVAAVHPGATIVLHSGAYGLVDDADNVVGSTSDLTLVGHGPTQPMLWHGNVEDPVLALEGVSNVTIYNLSIKRASATQKAIAPTVRLQHAKNVRFIETVVSAASDRGLELTDVRDFELRNSRVEGYHTAIADLIDATAITVVESKFRTSQRLIRGFSLLRSELEMSESAIVGHTAISSDQSVLFDLNAEHLAKRVGSATGAATGSTPTRADSKVTFIKSTLTSNRFSRLASPPDHLTMSGDSFDEAQFEDASRAGVRGWWCECHRERSGVGFGPVTVCHTSPARCTEETEKIDRGPTTSILVSSVMRPCRAHYARDPSERIGGRGQWSSGLGIAFLWPAAAIGRSALVHYGRTT